MIKKIDKELNKTAEVDWFIDFFILGSPDFLDFSEFAHRYYLVLILLLLVLYYVTWGIERNIVSYFCDWQ